MSCVEHSEFRLTERSFTLQSDPGLLKSEKTKRQFKCLYVGIASLVQTKTFILEKYPGWRHWQL